MTKTIQEIGWFFLFRINLSVESLVYYVYIIHSEKLDSYYIGFTEDLDRRIHQHNSHFYKSASTIKADDWNLFHKIPCDSKGQAMKIESHIKRAKSRKYLENLLKYPEIAESLKRKYQ